jgi:hypothetical protein
MGSCKLLNRHFITPMKLQCDMNSSAPIFKTTIVLKEKWIYFLNVLKVIIYVKFTNLQWYTTTYTSVIVLQVLHPQEVVFVTRHGFFFFVIRSYCVIGQVRVSMSKRMLDVFFFRLPLSMVSRSLFLSWLCGLEGSTVVDLCVMHANFLWLLLYFLIIR